MDRMHVLERIIMWLIGVAIVLAMVPHAEAMIDFDGGIAPNTELPASMPDPRNPVFCADEGEGSYYWFTPTECETL